ncbi:MAG: GAF domain-containing sensor histidine kinase [Verrucomicrobiota bacterium]
MLQRQSTGNKDRLNDLIDTGLLDVSEDEIFDRFSRIGSELFGTSIALVSLVAEDHQHFAGSCGLPSAIRKQGGTPLSHSFCKHVVWDAKPLVVNNARDDYRVSMNLAVEAFGIAAYLGVPLKSQRGHVLGAYCVIDTEPRNWTDQEVQLAEDIGLLVSREIELRRTAETLMDTSMQLEMAEEKNVELVQMMLHDLKNPLHTIRLALQILEEADSLEDDQREVLEMCTHSCVEMNNMLHSFIVSNKTKVTELSVRRKYIASEEVLTGIIEQATIQAKGCGIGFQAQLERCPEAFYADPDLLNRIIENLLANAFKYTPKGGQVELRVRPIENGRLTLFEVEDSGTGIPAEEREAIFDQYFSGKSGNHESIGLGLAFCKAAVAEHRGEITVQSAEGVGSTFRFYITND